MSDTPTQTGVQVIAAFARQLPGTPGVYRMLNAEGAMLYVGKARSLKKRVAAYTQPQKLPIRIQRMIADTASMEFTATHTEAEALLLEANLIKKTKPRYNILLRDDKSFPYILITGDHGFPQVTKHRGARDRKGEYFGPFASGYAVNETLAVLHRAFLLRNCSDTVFAQRTRPCLQYQIRRCTAPCVGKASARDYAQQVDMARKFLQGKSRDIQDQFLAAMQDASDKMDYEAAAAYRGRIRALTHVQSRQDIRIEGIENADVHVLYQDKGLSCVQVYFFRAGQSFGHHSYFPRHDKDETPEDILSAFVVQFYATRPPPEDIIASHPLVDKEVIEEALKIKAGHKVGILAPSRGRKKEMIVQAQRNAREALLHRLNTAASQEALFEKMGEAFGLPEPPERVEIFDNSHISGTNAGGAMVVATPEGFQKNAYRRFNFKTALQPGDDYGMMREMLTRRFQALLKNESAGEYNQRPDLILIDGGEGQLNVAVQVMADVGVDGVPIVAIAKGPDRDAGREKFFIPGRAPFSLEPGDPLLYFLQRLRDEAHRFAITSHRAKRSRSIAANPLDEIPGIGGKRKKALLFHFGSAKAVAEAGVADLQKVTGISRAVAERIYNFFHETEGG